MAALTVKEITAALLKADLTSDLAVAAGGGDTFTWGPTTVFMIVTGATGGQSVTATRQVTTVGSSQGVATLADVVESTSSDGLAILDTRPESFRDGSGNVNISYTAVVNMTVVPLKLAV